MFVRSGAPVLCVCVSKTCCQIIAGPFYTEDTRRNRVMPVFAPIFEMIHTNCSLDSNSRMPHSMRSPSRKIGCHTLNSKQELLHTGSLQGNFSSNAAGSSDFEPSI